MDRVDRNHSTLAQRRQGTHHDLPAGRKRDSAIKLNRRLRILIADPRGSARLRSFPVRLTTRHDVDLAIPGLEHANRQRGRTSKAIEPDSVTTLDSRDPQTAKADNSCTQQWRDMRSIERRRQWNREISANRNILRITAVHRVAREPRGIAQILHVVAAKPAVAIHSAHPGDANPRPLRYLLRSPLYYFAHNLVARNKARPQRRQFALNDVKIGAADATGEDLEQHFAWSWLGQREIFNRKPISRFAGTGIKNRCLHRNSSRSRARIIQYACFLN